MNDVSNIHMALRQKQASLPLGPKLLWPQLPLIIYIPSQMHNFTLLMMSLIPLLTLTYIRSLNSFLH